MLSSIESVRKVLRNKTGPLLYFLIAYSVGIYIQTEISILRADWIVGFVFLLLCLVYFSRSQKLFLVTALLFFVVLGIFRAQQSVKVKASPGEPPPGFSYDVHSFEGKVESYPTRSQDGYSFLVKLHTTSGRAKLFLKGEPAPLKGMTIRFRSNLHAARNYGNEFEWNYERYLSTRKIDYIGTISSSYDWGEVNHSISAFQKFFNSIRDRARESASIYMEPGHAALFMSLLLGDQGAVVSSDIEAFRKAGILHLLVISGSHVVLIAWFCSIVAGFGHRRSKWLIHRIPIFYTKIGFGFMGAFFFCLLTDFPVPTLRALAALCLISLLAVMGRESSPYSLWILAALSLLLIQPLYLLDTSAQLSFSAVLGILLFQKVRCPAKPKWFWVLFKMNLGATLATLPIVIYAFHEVSLWSFVGNLFFVPTIGGIATNLSILAAFVNVFFKSVGGFLFSLLDQILSFLLPAVHAIANLPASDVWVATPSMFQLIGYLMLLTAFYLSIRKHKLIAALGATLMLLPSMIDRYRHAVSDEVRFLSVGQGDAVWIRSKGGGRVLIDTGPQEKALLPWLKAHGERNLDLLVLTHDDQDHIGGAPALLKTVNVREIWYSGSLLNSAIKLIQEESHRRGIQWTFPSAPLQKNILGIQMTVLHPSPGYKASKDNNQSIVLAVELGGERFLFTGDMEAPVERLLLKRRAALNNGVLKVAHHGSQTSTTEEFVNYANPKVAVISVGYRNHFHHPSQAVTDRLQRHRNRIFRTDLCGEVMFQKQRLNFEIFTVRPCEKSL